jgi:uncharacterized membrane protein YphA (DoxX/SURF4 family)
LWIVSALLALLFVVTGASKVFGIAPSPANFARWGLSPSFRYFIGAAEIAGGIGLLVPLVARFAAAGLLITMLGAIRTGVVFHETMHIVLPAVLAVMLVWIIAMRSMRKR